MINKIQPIKWRKLWEFHFPIWLLDRLIDTHIKFKERLGYENQDTLHIYSNTSEEAYFSEQELEKLKQERKNKLLSKEYMELHEEAALQAIENIKVIPNDLFEYSKLLEELLSFYRASRPEIFELIEDKTNQEYVKNLIKKYGELRFKLKEVWFNAEKRAERASAALKRYTKSQIPVVNDSKIPSNNSDEFFSANEGSNSNNSENFTYFIEEYEKELGRPATEEEKQRFREKYFS